MVFKNTVHHFRISDMMNTKKNGIMKVVYGVSQCMRSYIKTRCHKNWLRYEIKSWLPWYDG